jgi:NAD(P)-dependent dehydrogenase (short-subunit alcohol dehydrogenase family)
MSQAFGRQSIFITGAASVMGLETLRRVATRRPS